MEYSNIKIGDTAEIVHRITEEDISKFVSLTGDDNKLHLDSDFASRTEFKKPVVHGMLGASFISTLIGTKLPGDGALWYSQNIEFIRPVRVGDTLRISAKVVAKLDKLNSIELEIVIYNQHKQVVTTGLSKVKVLDIATDNKVEDNIQIKSGPILILGASGGIGSALSLKLAEEGFNLILHYNTNQDLISKLSDAIRSQGGGGNVEVYKADLQNQQEIDSFLGFLNRNHTNLKGFVNCSTIKVPGYKFDNLDWSILENHININVRTNFQFCKGLLPIFKKNNYGKIVFLTSQYIETPPNEMLHYVTAKSALSGFAKSLAIEFSPFNINVNMVSPSMIDTDLVSDVPIKQKMLVAAKTPLKKLCTTSDVSNAVSFLLSTGSDFITGETIRINGGIVMI
jgi:3-oxoacyl-[acyl-carrier protein] reductase